MHRLWVLLGAPPGVDTSPVVHDPIGCARKQMFHSCSGDIDRQTETGPVVGYFYCMLGVCFACYVVRTVFNMAHYRGSQLAKGRGIISLVYVIMALLWFSWFQMCFTDPFRVDLPDWIRYAGLLLFVAGVSLFLMSHLHLGGFKGDGGLRTGGIYSKIRNPMYLGFVIWIFGLPLFTGSMVTLACSPMWIAHIMIWRILEERELLEKYPEYSEYRKRTWF